MKTKNLLPRTPYSLRLGRKTVRHLLIAIAGGCQLIACILFMKNSKLDDYGGDILLLGFFVITFILAFFSENTKQSLLDAMIASLPAPLLAILTLGSITVLQISGQSPSQRVISDRISTTLYSGIIVFLLFLSIIIPYVLAARAVKYSVQIAIKSKR